MAGHQLKILFLKVAGLLTVSGGTGCIVEYFGEGAESISCTGKATICNMGAEIGATCSLFGYDDAMAKFLWLPEEKRLQIWQEITGNILLPTLKYLQNPARYYDQFIEINLSELEPYINGPYTPDLATPVSKMKEAAAKNNWPVDVEVGLIGSCTNSSYEDISRAASVVENALKVKLDCQI